MKHITGRLKNPIFIMLAGIFICPVFFGKNSTAIESPAIISVSTEINKISITFSQEMNCQSLQNALRVKVRITGLGYGTLSGKPVECTGESAIFLPYSDLQQVSEKLKYSLIITTDAKDINGTPLASEYESEINPSDKDGDGYTNDEDCDDDNPSVYPGAKDICGDGIDQDCNGKDAVCISELITIEGDGILIFCDFYKPKSDMPSPAVILLHTDSNNRQIWADNGFAEKLLENGYAVLAVDMRGYGYTGGEKDWDKAINDMKQIWRYLTKQADIDQSRIVFLGAGIGANIALAAASVEPDVRNVVLLSPGLDYQGITTADKMESYGDREILMIADEETESADACQTLKSLAKGNPAEVKIYPGKAYGTDLLDEHEDLDDKILEWLDTYLKYPGDVYAIKVIPAEMNVIPGQRSVFLVRLIPHGTELGDTRVQISAKASGSQVTVYGESLVEGKVAEIEVIPDDESASITLFIQGDWKDQVQHTAEANLYVGQGVDDLGPMALSMQNIFIPWLAANHPELGITADTKWSGTIVKPDILVVMHYLFFSEKWEMGILWHVMIPPYDWTSIYLRERYTEASPSLGFKVDSVSEQGEPYPVEPPEDVDR